MPKGKKQNKQHENNIQDKIVENVIESEIIEENNIEENNIEENNIEETVKPEKIIRGTVICNKLNVRKDADKNSEVLTIIPKDLVLTICDIESSSEFYKVLIGELEGYCMKKFIAIIAE